MYIWYHDVLHVGNTAPPAATSCCGCAWKHVFRLVCRVSGGDENKAAQLTLVLQDEQSSSRRVCESIRVSVFCRAGRLLCLCKLSLVSICVHGTESAPDLDLCVCCCVTCLCSSDEGSVPLAVLPVHFQVRTLSQRYDDVHETLVTRHLQSSLRERREEKTEAEREELKSASRFMEIKLKHSKEQIHRKQQEEKRI